MKKLSNRNKEGKRYFEGVRVYTLNFGLFRKGAAMTLPGLGIFIGLYSTDNIDLLRHEFGHILQYREWGFIRFYWSIAPASLRSANRANKDSSFVHMDTWCEWSANRLSYHYFNKPLDWNMAAYPIRNKSSRPGAMPPFSSGVFEL